MSAAAGWQDYEPPKQDDGWQDEPAKKPPAAVKAEEPGVLDRADSAITKSLEPNPENVKGWNPPLLGPTKEAGKIIGRTAYSAGKSILGAFPAAYHAFSDDPTEEEKSHYADFEKQQGEEPGTETSGLKRIGLGLDRMIARPIANAYEEYSHGRVTPKAALSVAPEAIGQGIGTVLLGKAIGEVPGIAKSAVKAIPNRGAIAQKIVGPLTYESVGETAGDVRTGANPERGLVDEGLVGTKKGLVAKSDTRLGELKASANKILDTHPNAKAVIDAEPLIDSAVNDAIAQAKKVGGDSTRLEAIRTALKNEYGKIKGTPREMNDLKSAIQESADQLGAYKNTQPLEASAANALRSAAAKIKDAVNAKVPEAADMNQRMQDLADARRGIQRKVNQARGEDLFSKNASNTAGMVGKIAQRTIGSAPVRTAIARAINAGNVKRVP